MKKQSQSGFAIAELVLVVVIVAAIAGVGYYVWHSHNQKTLTTTASNTSNSPTYQSPSTVAPAAPQVNNASDLNGAMQALNQTDVTAGNTDSGQLSSQASGF